MSSSNTPVEIKFPDQTIVKGSLLEENDSQVRLSWTSDKGLKTVAWIPKKSINIKLV